MRTFKRLFKRVEWSSIECALVSSCSIWRTTPSRSTSQRWRTLECHKVGCVICVLCNQCILLQRHFDSSPSCSLTCTKRWALLHSGRHECGQGHCLPWKNLQNYCEHHTMLSQRSSCIATPIPQDCDEFTRNFLRKLGVRVPPSETTPNDPYTMHQGKVWVTHCNLHTIWHWLLTGVAINSLSCFVPTENSHYAAI